LHTLIFTSLNREWYSDDLSSILSSISGEPVADGGLGHLMGLVATWHVLIGIMKRHLHDLVDKYKLTDELFNEQSGHGESKNLPFPQPNYSQADYWMLISRFTRIPRIFFPSYSFSKVNSFGHSSLDA
jgi:hypothetical protein